MAKSVSVTTEFDQVHRTVLFWPVTRSSSTLFYLPFLPVPPVPPISVSLVLSLSIPLAAPQVDSVLDHLSYPCFEAVGDVYRLLSILHILHIPLKIEMLTIGGETSIVNEAFLQ